MAATVHSGVYQQVFSNDDEVGKINSLILNKTGHPPVNAEHLHNFMQHLNAFPHPCPTDRTTSGGTLPTSSHTITEDLQGWDNLNQQEKLFVQTIFSGMTDDDKELVYDKFFQKLGRAPTVLEFFRFLLTYEGKLYLENKEIRKSLKNHHRTMELLREMLASKDTMLEALGQSCANHTRDLDQQRNYKQQLQRILCTVQQEKAQLQLEFNSLQHDHVQCYAELEDERSDKQVYMQRCHQLEIDKQGLQNTVTAQTETITDMRVRIDENDNYIDRLTDKVKEMKQRLHKESNEKSNILQVLIQKSHIVSELEKDKEILMLENEAQGKYFLELKGEKMQLEKENTELKISVRKCKAILTEQYDHVIQSIEASLLLLNDNLTQMSVKNSELENVTEQQSAKISDLESKNSHLEGKTELQSATISDLEIKNSHLESKTEQQSATISDLEIKNSHLESKTEQQSATISDLESKNSHLESKTEQQSATISDLEIKNSHLESKTEQQSATISDLESKNSHLESKTEQQSATISDLESKNSDLESKNSDLESKTELQSATISDLESKTELQSATISDLESKTELQSATISDLESKNSHLESRTDHQSVKIHDLEFRLQEQKQRQQYFTLFMAAIIFALVCLLCSTQKDNLPSIS
ncbi:uncharacterized protein LOC144622601 isoform X2 [Crassostrea virginica]